MVLLCAGETILHQIQQVLMKKVKSRYVRFETPVSSDAHIDVPFAATCCLSDSDIFDNELRGSGCAIQLDVSIPIQFRTGLRPSGFHLVVIEVGVAFSDMV